MLKETKQDRLVRGMFDQMAEHILDIKNLSQNPSTKELDVERWAQSVLKNCLGYTASSGYSITAQEHKGKMRPDLIVSKDGKPIFVMEVKKLSFDLDKSDFRSGKVQLNEYLHAIGDVKFGILCNGTQWRLFNFEDHTVGGVEIARVDLFQGAETIESTKKFVEELCYEFADFHGTVFSSGEWENYTKEATAFSPESLAKAILSFDSVKNIAKVIRGEHEYKANVEILLDKLADLLHDGLDDSVPGWNETKSAEFSNYVKAQKRAARRPKRSAKKNVDDTTRAHGEESVPASATESPNRSTPTEGQGSAA